MTASALVATDLIPSGKLADILGVNRSTIFRWQREGIIQPATMTAKGQARWRLEDVRRQLAEHQGDRKTGDELND